MIGIDGIWSGIIDDRVHACNCVSPKNGQPLCPCAMSGVRVIDGEYVRIEKLGKVKNYED